MDEPERFSSGVEAFDRLQPNQKLALLALVGDALKDEAEPRPELTAHTEATVAAIFHHIVDQVVFEIEMTRGVRSRRGRDVLAAACSGGVPRN